MGELRESKKRETRQRISDVATALFFARGFEAVTIEEIAIAAQVSKPTVFNYYTRKEDLFLDREDDVKHFMREALRERPKGQSPIGALRRLVDSLCEQKRTQFTLASTGRRSAGGASLRRARRSVLRVREIGDEAVEGLAIELAGPEPDGIARLIAGMIVVTWRTAYADAVRAIRN